MRVASTRTAQLERQIRTLEDRKRVLQEKLGFQVDAPATGPEVGSAAVAFARQAELAQIFNDIKAALNIDTSSESAEDMESILARIQMLDMQILALRQQLGTPEGLIPAETLRPPDPGAADHMEGYV